MADPQPNPGQRTLIEHEDGIAVVDAGPGTGKTFAVARRYARLIDRPDVEPEDVLLVTFTRNAATEMRERIVDRSGYPPTELADAPIRTFHAHCNELLREYGRQVPQYLGIEETMAESTEVVDSASVERELFREFIGRFRDEHQEHADQFRALSNPVALLNLIGKLAAKGILPTASGWYRNGEDHLLGEYEDFQDRFEAVNRPRNGGRKQSTLRERLGRYGTSKTFQPGAPQKERIRGEGKRVDPALARKVFEEDRGDLISFVHDVYFEYLTFCLARNYLNFGFLQMFAFVLLCEEDDLRRIASFRYVMIDEFQDTSEIQFKLALLLTAESNLLVVGDWKQSIYSFQYAAVENITNFARRLRRFAGELNAGRSRVEVDASAIERIELRENYRSTDAILRFAEDALVTPATSRDDVDPDLLDDVVELSSNAPLEDSVIEAAVAEEEPEAVLAKVDEIVGNDRYAVRTANGGRRQPGFGDIAVLTRTHAFGRTLTRAADDHDYPFAYDGGVELFRSDPAKLLLAWLRIVASDADRGWAVVLEAQGESQAEIDHRLHTHDFPSTMLAFRDRLRSAESVGTVARYVFDRYGFDDDRADVLLHVVRSLHDRVRLTLGDLIGFLERGIERGSTHEVQTSAGKDSVTVQTIHAVKGLEYPIVILANMNEGQFPPRGGRSPVIQFREPVGLRQRQVCSTAGDHPHVYHRWQYDVYRHCLDRSYAEERRLLYVALTRAEQHLSLVGGENPNPFLEGLPVEVAVADTAVPSPPPRPTVQTQLPFAVDPPSGPVSLTPHDLMDEGVIVPQGEHDDDVGRGTDFGSRVHDFAEDYARDPHVPLPDDASDALRASIRNVKAFIDGLTGDMAVEREAILPLRLDGTRASLNGVIDLVHVRSDGIDVVDYKTDRTRRAHEEYRKQVSVYFHVVDAWYTDRPVTATLLYTRNAELVEVDPLPLEDIRGLARQHVRG